MAFGITVEVLLTDRYVRKEERVKARELHANKGPWTAFVASIDRILIVIST